MKWANYSLLSVCLASGLITTPKAAFAQTAGPNAGSGPIVPGCEQHTNHPLCALAQRFRPYLKFSFDNNQIEPNHPCTWQFFVEDSDLFHTRNIDTPIGSIEIPDATVLNRSQLANIELLLASTGADVRTDAQYPHLWLVPEDHGGEDWGSVMNGDGIYAHVEPINEDLINIEYWQLYAFNTGLNNTFCEFFAGSADHNGDLTVVALVYSKAKDQIIRATFVRHGFFIGVYDLTNPPIALTTTLPDETVPAKRLALLNNYENNPCVKTIAGTCVAHFHTPCSFAEGGAQVYFAQDPNTGLFDHIAVFFEWGNHEPWPAPCGSDNCVPNHFGKGESFLPTQVTYLGTMSDMVSPNYDNPPFGHTPFIFFNGKWGSDPQPPTMHNEWYYPIDRCKDPSGRGNPLNIGSDRFVDEDPYSSVDVPAFPWPPEGDCAWVSRPPTTTTSFTGPTYSNGGSSYVSGMTTIGFSIVQDPITDKLTTNWPTPDNKPQNWSAATYPAPQTNYSVFRVGATPPPFVSASTLILAPPDGAYKTDYYSVDRLNNKQATQSLELILDTTPPLITITQPSAASYPHSDILTLGYGVSDGQGSGVKSFTTKIDGVTTVSGHGLLSGQTINLLTELSLGTHTFSVDSVDNVNNASSRSVTFSIIVTPDSIKGDVNQFLQAGALKNKGRANSLLDKLDSAAAARARGQCSTAANVYHAFINELQAQSGKGMTAAAAEVMTADAQYLIAHCP